MARLCEFQGDVGITPVVIESCYSRMARQVLYRQKRTHNTEAAVAFPDGSYIPAIYGSSCLYSARKVDRRFVYPSSALTGFLASVCRGPERLEYGSNLVVVNHPEPCIRAQDRCQRGIPFQKDCVGIH